MACPIQILSVKWWLWEKVRYTPVIQVIWCCHNNFSEKPGMFKLLYTQTYKSSIRANNWWNHDYGDHWSCNHRTNCIGATTMGSTTAGTIGTTTTGITTTTTILSQLLWFQWSHQYSICILDGVTEESRSYDIYSSTIYFGKFMILSQTSVTHLVQGHLGLYDMTR